MKKVTLWSCVGLVVFIGLAIVMAFQMGDVSPVVASGTVRIESGLQKNASMARYLFIVVHDAESRRPSDP